MSDWDRFLETLEAPPVSATSVQAVRIRQMWREIQSFIEEFPRVTEGDEKGDLKLSWSREHVYVEINILPDASYTWFARHRIKDCYDGIGEPITGTPPQTLLDWLNTITTNPVGAPA